MPELILFQGDSITDAVRLREDERDVYSGHGYVTMISGKLGLTHPGKCTVRNRGVACERIVDIYARVKTDIINNKPDYVSLLVGVNDVLHGFSLNNGIDTKKFEMLYSLMIKEITEALPDVKIIILEPFILEGECTSQKHGDNYPLIAKEIAEKASASKRIAEKYNLSFVPLQAEFDRLCNIQPPSYWLFDGIHPSPAGHAMIAEKWLEVFERSV